MHQVSSAPAFEPPSRTRTAPRPRAQELRIQTIDLAKVLQGMQAHQPVTVSNLNDWGIIQVVPA